MGHLHNLGLHNGTDKALYHQYLDFYERLLPKESICRLLEIGVDNGYSLKMWRDWLGEGPHVEGWDLNLLHVPQCLVRQVDQSDRTQMKRALTGHFDVIVDDGAHLPRTIETSFSFLFPHCSFYVIEDLHAWWLGYQEGEEISTIDLLESLSDGWRSTYALSEEADYINQYAELVEVYYRGPRDCPTSMTAVIRNTDQDLDQHFAPIIGQ